MKIYARVLFIVLVVSVIMWACSTDKDPLPSQTHPSEWNELSSDEFHGEKVTETSYSTCKSCHGTNLDGGRSEVSCTQCHELYPHEDTWNEFVSTNFHGNYIRTQNWSMTECQDCHGSDYRGGRSGFSCYGCHPGTNGPQSCNVCHGNLQNAAPPEDLNNKTSVSEMGVGAHQVMITDFVENNADLNKYNVCSVCHAVPSSVSSSGHIDNTTHAEVLSTLGWNRTTRTCANSCHGTAGYVWNNF